MAATAEAGDETHVLVRLTLGIIEVSLTVWPVEGAHLGQNHDHRRNLLRRLAFLFFRLLPQSLFLIGFQSSFLLVFLLPMAGVGGLCARACWRVMLNE